MNLSWAAGPCIHQKISLQVDCSYRACIAIVSWRVEAARMREDPDPRSDANVMCMGAYLSLKPTFQIGKHTRHGSAQGSACHVNPTIRVRQHLHARRLYHPALPSYLQMMDHPTRRWRNSTRSQRSVGKLPTHLLFRRHPVFWVHWPPAVFSTRLTF